MNRRIIMLNEFPSVDDLVKGIVGTTGFLSTLTSPKSGMIITLLVLGVMVAKMIFG